MKKTKVLVRYLTWKLNKVSEKNIILILSFFIGIGGGLIALFLKTSVFYLRKLFYGCQLMIELDLINPDHKSKVKMLHNESKKFESAFLNVDIQENESVMLNSLSGKRLGIWVAHGEGKFDLPGTEDDYNIAMKYSNVSYPGNPNVSDYSTAALYSSDGRHLAMMPHLERAFLPYQCAHYPEERKDDEVSPWIEAFINARDWIKEQGD